MHRYKLIDMKVRPLFWKTLLTVIICILICGAILFVVCLDLFLNTKWGWQQPTLIAIWGALSIILILYTLFGTYYEVERKYVVVHKGFKKLIYYYVDVVYIDEEKSVKKKMVHFYTNKGHTRYLTFDKKNILYRTMISNCKNRITAEEFAMRYPKVKL